MNTTGRERFDLQIQQIKTTEKVVKNKKIYSRKGKNRRNKLNS